MLVHRGLRSLRSKIVVTNLERLDDVPGVMSVPDEIDDLIGVLRSPALPSELADEQRAIADMAGACRSSTLQSSVTSVNGGTDHHAQHFTPSSSRRPDRDRDHRLRWGGRSRPRRGLRPVTRRTRWRRRHDHRGRRRIHHHRRGQRRGDTTTVADRNDHTLATHREATPVAGRSARAKVSPLVDDPETTFDETSASRATTARP